MSVVQTVLGPNSQQFTTVGETSPLPFVTAVQTYLVSKGWDLFDTVDSGFGLLTKVHRAINKDGATYKYLIMRFNLVTHKLYTSAAESWDAATNAATNETFSWLDSMPVPFNINGSDFVVFASPRYALFMSFVANEPSGWQGVMENEREAAEDTAEAGYPCFGWINSTSHGASVHASANLDWGSAPTHGYSFPRNRLGYTGINATWTYTLTSSPVGGDGIKYSSTSYSGIKCAEKNYGGNLGDTYGWDTNKKAISSIRHHIVTPHGTAPASSVPVYGRLFGLKSIPRIGELMNKVSVKVDSDGFHNATGEAADHYVLNSTAKVLYAGLAVGDPGLTVGRVSVGTATRVYAMATSGSVWYLGTNAGVYKYNTNGGTVALVAGTSGDATDIVYDGSRYIYYVTNGSTNNLVRIDTQNNDALTMLSIAGYTQGMFSLALDTQYLIATNRLGSTTDNAVQVQLSDFSVVRKLNFGHNAAAIWPAICTDNKGKFYAVCTSGATAADYKIAMIDSATGGTSNAPLTIANVALAGITHNGVEPLVVGQSGTTMYMQRINSSLGVTEQISLVTTTPVASGSHYRLNITPVNGRYWVQSHASSGGVLNWFTFNYTPTASSLYGMSNSFQTTMGSGSAANGTNTTSGRVESVWTDGVRLVQFEGSRNSLTILGGMYNRYKNTGHVLNQYLIPA